MGYYCKDCSELRVRGLPFSFESVTYYLLPILIISTGSLKSDKDFESQ